MQHSVKNGFTLIELSIVLVIIGLIVGGILVGQDLIRVAQLRADVSTLEKFDQAVNTFKSKYNCLPGDCSNFSSFFSTPSPEDGNGNGIIDDNGIDSYYFMGYEMAYAIDHLYRANLIAGTPFDANNNFLDPTKVIPHLPSGGSFIIRQEIIFTQDSYPTGHHTYRLGINYEAPGMVNTMPGIYSPADAYYIDSKIDDGIPVSGRVTAAQGNNDDGNYPFMPISGEFNGSGYPDGDCVGVPGVPYGCRSYDLTITDKMVGLFVQATF